MITKLRDTTTQDWFFLTGEIYNDRGKYQKFNESGSIVSETTVYPNTATTSTVYSVGTDNSVNGSGSKYVSYCWAEIPGYSKFGSYYGNNDGNGQYVYMGFRPAWILIKRSSSESWVMGDIKRNSNAGRRTPADSYILADGSGTEATGIIYEFLSDGIKFGNTSQNEASVYYYWAFAEQMGATPFGTDVNAG